VVRVVLLVRSPRPLLLALNAACLFRATCCFPFVMKVSVNQLHISAAQLQSRRYACACVCVCVCMEGARERGKKERESGTDAAIVQETALKKKKKAQRHRA
jgi:hypothetical protein